MFESTSSQAHFFERLPVACYACDRSGVITGFNRRAADLWGRDPQPADRFTGAHKIFDISGSFIPPEALPTAFLLRSGLAQRNHELVIEKPNGSRVTVLSNVAPLTGADGAIIGVVDVLQDITDRRWSEDARRVAERVSASARIAADVARQIKPPLVSMTALLDLLSQDSTLSAQGRGYAELVRQELSQFDRLAKQMTNLSGIA